MLLKSLLSIQQPKNEYICYSKYNTCFTLQELKNIATELNITKNKTKKQLAKAIEQKLMRLQIKLSDNNKDKDALTTSQMFKIMTKIRKQYSDLEFIGVYPINLKSPYKMLEKINRRKFENKKKKLVIIWNTDTHKGPGLHWIVLFIHFDKKQICYFDSLAQKIPIQIKKLLIYLQKNFITYSIFINQKKFQKTNKNCGIFVLYFIMTQLQNYPCEKFEFENSFTDKTIEKIKCFFLQL